MNRRSSKLSVVSVAFLSLACGTSLDTRSFELRHLDEDVARQLIEPYVYSGRESNPGTMSAVQGVLTVRETRDNLNRIAQALEEFDRPRQSLALSFQVIFGDGASSTDPAIAEVVSELRKLFRFEGYQLRAEGVVTGLERTRVHQKMFDQGESNQQMVFGSYDVTTFIGSVSGPADSSVVDLSLELHGENQGLLETSVVLGIGNTVVMGTLQLPGDRALILTVRAELAP